MTDTTSIITATLMFADLHDGELRQLESAASQLTLRRGDVLSVSSMRTGRNRCGAS